MVNCGCYIFIPFTISYFFAFLGFSLSLPAPQNLTIKSYNFQNVLSWSPVRGINGPVFYSVQWNSTVFILYCREYDQTWKKVNCRDITKPECDFESKKDIFAVIFRVRAEEGNLKSEWTETLPFVANKDSIDILVASIYSVYLLLMLVQTNSLMYLFHSKKNIHVFHWYAILWVRKF
uniref:Fibronectin type-III domain-containing protein n=1 Tax=Laticauda laticaudata TaxID=8630 RepID=A0A8C5WPZ3_LATLA